MLFNFYISGHVVVELLLKKEEKIYKLPLYLLFSVVFSTNLIYFLSLLLGYNNFSIYLSYFIWVISFVFIVVKNRSKKDKVEEKHNLSIFLAVLILICYMFVLNKSIFSQHGNYFVMSSDNWQDTAMHMSIIESLNQDNFPPIAPYFSGKNLSYHYFSDFHSAILTRLNGEFNPKILVIDNSMFAMVFSLSIYVLTYYLTKSKFAGIISMILALFSGSFIYTKLLDDWLNGAGPLKDLLSSSAYVLEYGKLYQMAPITNYFLQNRPMMVGMPAVASAIYLVLSGIKENNKIKIFLSLALGILTLKFQIITSLVIFAFVVFVFLILNYKKLYYFAPLILIGYFYKDYSTLFFDNFSLRPWVDDKSLFWFIKFYFLNLGIPFILTLLFALILLFKRIKVEIEIKSLLILVVFLIIIPIICTFTIDRADMLKFFYIAYTPMCVLSSIYLNRIMNKKNGWVVVIIFLLFSVPTGLVDLAGSYLNKNLGYTISDYMAGEWIRNNTLKNSIFMTSPTVHNPASDIAGRLRILSYTNWPYTHGYNIGEDNVFTRQEDVNLFFNNLSNKLITTKLIEKYMINYVYYGQDELSDFPEAKNKLESNSSFEKIYEREAIEIYKIKI